MLAPPSPALLHFPTRLSIALLAPLPADANRQLRADIAASFQRVAVAHLEERCRRAVGWVKESHPQGGGRLGVRLGALWLQLDGAGLAA